MHTHNNNKIAKQNNLVVITCLSQKWQNTLASSPRKAMKYIQMKSSQSICPQSKKQQTIFDFSVQSFPTSISKREALQGNLFTYFYSVLWNK